MDWIDTLAPLGLVGVFVGNELCLALAAGSYGIVYIPMRVVVIPACSSLLIAFSVVQWSNARRREGERGKRPWVHLAGVVTGIAVCAFQWFSSWTLF